MEEIIEPPMEVRSYLVPILFKREPVDKNVPIADIFYRKEANLIELQCHRPNYHSELEMIIAGDISIATDTGATRVISKSEAPISWITKLYQSKEFSGHPFIAGEAQEIYEA
jgi:hypothetical protein